MQTVSSFAPHDSLRRVIPVASAAAELHGDTPAGWMVQCDFDGTISTADVTD